MTSDRLLPGAKIDGAHLREWNQTPAFVEIAIFGSDDALAVAESINAFCLRGGGSGTLYQSSVRSVIGIVLSDGRRVVIKAHLPDVKEQRLAEIARILTATRPARHKLIILESEWQMLLS